MKTFVSRRGFLGGAVAACAALTMSNSPARAAKSETSPAGRFDFPLLDLHVHLDNSTIDKILELSPERGAKFGIVEHAGTKENQYPVVLSNDEELKRYVQMLEGKPVFKGVQAEWNDWMRCFSRGALAQLDYVLTDTMTFPGKDSRRVKLWERDVANRVDMSDPQKWMDRYVDWHLEILSRQPIDILANVSWLPAPLAEQYELLWTPARIRRVVESAAEHRVALEISSSYKLPKPGFLKLAKTTGVKFSFGSNGRYPKMGLLDYSLAMAKELDLKRTDLFTPAPDGQKAVQRRKY